MLSAVRGEGGGQFLQGFEGGLQMRGRKVGCLWLVSGHLHFILHIERKEKEMSETDAAITYFKKKNVLL